MISLNLKFWAFSNKTQLKPETEKWDKEEKKGLTLNYDKIRISRPKENKIRAFVTVFSREDGVCIYDYFYKMKTRWFSSMISLITGVEIFKKHTIREMKIYESKKKQQRIEKECSLKIEEEKKQEIEKWLDLNESIIAEDEDENYSSARSKDEEYDDWNDADNEVDSN